jgi:hypothetical protein
MGSQGRGVESGESARGGVCILVRMSHVVRDSEPALLLWMTEPAPI